MRTQRLTLLLLLFALACNGPKETAEPTVAITGVTIIDGTGSEPIQDGVLLIRGGRVIAVGKKGEVAIPEDAEVQDMAGKFIMPGIINSHGHVGDVIGIEGGKYSRENVIANLATYARYGITTVVSLGGDKKEAVALRAVNDSTPGLRARLFISGTVITGKTPQEAVARVDSNKNMGVDFMKIRVDDNLGSATKMSEEVYRAVIARSHELGFKIATHMYYLDDAKKLLDAGSDLMAHSVRDLPVDTAFINSMKSRKVCYCPTFTRELSTFVYGSTPDFFSDPFFKKEFDSLTVQPLRDPVRQEQVRNSKSGMTYKKQLPTAMANLKTLSEKGVTITFGTDSGIPTRFMGYFEHLEMGMMADAGLTPMQIIVSATKNPAECLGLKDLGTLTPGHWADFLVLDADPLADIRNVSKLGMVFVGGKEVSGKR